MAHVVLTPLNPEASAKFFLRVSDGVGLSTGDPILAFRARVMAPGSEKRLVAPQKPELIFRYWNAWREGKSLGGRLRRVGSWPKLVS